MTHILDDERIRKLMGKHYFSYALAVDIRDALDAAEARGKINGMQISAVLMGIGMRPKRKTVVTKAKR